MKNYKRSSLALSVMAAIALAGCNSSSSDPEITPPPGNETPVFTEGTFVDTVVEGLHYVAKPSGTAGTTDVNGAYEMEEGDTLHFYLGGEAGLHIGSVSPRDVVSPFEATGTYRRAINLAILLQSLDEQLENDDLIELPADIIEIEGSDEALLEDLQNINLDDFTTIEEFLLKRLGDATKIVTEEEAIAHLETSLKEYDRGDESKMSDWTKASGKYLRSTYVSLTSQYSSREKHTLVHVDNTLPQELTKLMHGAGHMAFHLNSNDTSTMLAGTNDSSYSEDLAQAYLSCKSIGLELEYDEDQDPNSPEVPPKCIDDDGVETDIDYDDRFNIKGPFSYNISDPYKTMEEDEVMDWDEFPEEEQPYKCLIAGDCSQRTMTSFYVGQDMDERDVTLSSSYDHVTGVLTVITHKEEGDRQSEHLDFHYLTDSKDSDRYVDFKGTWEAVSHRVGCDVNEVTSTYTFTETGVEVEGKEFESGCEVDEFEAELTYEEFAQMDWWWFATNEGVAKSKATLAQLNTTVRWCDLEEDDEGDLNFERCEQDGYDRTKINKWEYAPVGEDWDKGVLIRNTLNPFNGEILDTETYRKVVK